MKNYILFLLFSCANLLSGCITAKVHVANPNNRIMVDVTANGAPVVSSFQRGYASRELGAAFDEARVDVMAESYVWERGIKMVIDTIRVVLRLDKNSDVKVKLDKEGRIDVNSVDRHINRR